MKLKYYMRGLGIGILLTTLIFIISGNKEKLTDQEIIQRASTLGMVMKEETKNNLDKVLEDIKPTESADSEDVSPTPKITPVPTQTPTPEPSATPTPKPTATPAPTKKPVKTEDGKKNTTATKESFTIKSGMSSDMVANLLHQVGLVDDAKKFNDYIVKSGKASVIRVGTYSIAKGATYQEITKLITTK